MTRRRAVAIAAAMFSFNTRARWYIIHRFVRLIEVNMLTCSLVRWVFVGIVPLMTSSALAWGPDGHHAVGAIAARLLAGSHAEREVKSLLGNVSLEEATVWADCAKGIDPAKNLTYTVTGKFPECAIYENPASEAEMADYIRRNDPNCPRKPEEESCTRQYHYADIAVQHGRYQTQWIGARDYDVVHAIAAAVHVLKGEPAPAPFSIKSQREALLLLAHFVGDIHQPLHVGTVYLDANGKRVNPDTGAFDPHTEVHGGNSLREIVGDRVENFHGVWDAIPARFNATHISKKWLAEARQVRKTPGLIDEWPQRWASESVKAAREAFEGVKFSSEQENHWLVSLPPAYNEKMTAIKKEQLTAAGARLAQVLQAVWP